MKLLIDQNDRKDGLKSQHFDISFAKPFLSFNTLRLPPLVCCTYLSQPDKYAQGAHDALLRGGLTFGTVISISLFVHVFMIKRIDARSSLLRVAIRRPKSHLLIQKRPLFYPHLTKTKCQRMQNIFTL